MSETETTAVASATLRGLVEQLATHEPAWLAQARREALERYEATPLPDRVEHLWRYTDPAKLLPGETVPAPAEGAFGDIPGEFHDGTYEHAAAYALCRDGAMLRSTVDPLLAGKGLILEDLRSAAKRHEKLVRPRLFSLGATADGIGAKFDLLAAAAFQGGSFVHLPPRTELELPLRVASRTGGEGLRASRSLVLVGDQSRATLVFDLTSADETATSLVHETTELFVGAGARLRVVFVQSMSRRTTHVPIVRAHVERDALLESVTVALGGGLVKSLQTVVLAGPGASAKVIGIVFGDHRQHFDHHTFLDHAAPHTTSDLDYRVVVADRARSAYTGRLRITPAGVGTDAHQRNHNLLLSEHARADTIPELEILTNDVKCSHAAAVGPIDEEQVFFCASRGLSPEEARRVIVLGFMEPVVATVPGEKLQERVRNALDERLVEKF